MRAFDMWAPERYQTIRSSVSTHHVGMVHGMSRWDQELAYDLHGFVSTSTAQVLSPVDCKLSLDSSTISSSRCEA